VIGDLTYGAPAKLRLGRKELPTLGRTFLHAAKLAFAHPVSGETLELEAPLPHELAVFLHEVENLDT